MPVFSVIVPVYNVEPYLAQCVNSVLRQTWSDFELILVDDGATDGSGMICDRYAQADARVRVIHKPNGGVASARNLGMACAKGTYIVFLDSDDYWDWEDALTALYQAFGDTTDVVLFKYRKLFMDTGAIEENTDPSTDADIAALPYGRQLRCCVERQLFDACAWNKAFRRQLALQHDLTFREGIIAEDVDWAARLALAASGLAIVDRPFHIYRKGRPGALTSSLKVKNLIDTKGSIERCLQDAGGRQMDPAQEEAYYGYVAYRYVIWMAESSVVGGAESRRLMQQMKQYRWLLRYDLNRKVKAASLLERMVGFRMASDLLGLYLKRKR